MKTLAIISQKGGVGKTTLAVHLAVTAQLRGLQALLIDLDPQSSAEEWGDSRDADTPTVVPGKASRLPKMLDAAHREGAQLAIIDTAPHSQSEALDAARAADFILVPCRPAVFDLRAIKNSAKVIELAGQPAAAVLNGTKPRSSKNQEARDVIEGLGLTVAPVLIGDRVAFSNAVIDGRTAEEYEPGGKAAQEIDRLYIWFTQQIGLNHE